MAVTSVPTNGRVVKYERSFYREYIRANRFSKYIGADESAIIQLNEDLTKTVGETINFELVNRLVGNQNTLTGSVSGVTSGVTGYNTLEGNEEALGIRNWRLTVTRNRWAVTHDALDEQFSAIDLVEAKNATLQDWFKENIRDRIVLNLNSFSTDGTTHQAYASTSAADRNTWTVNNVDRVLFGSTTANYSATHATGITACDTTNDLLSTTTMQALKDMAKAANPKVRPVKVNDEEEWYVMFVGTRAFRSAQSALQSVVNQPMLQGNGKMDNPLFTSGDLTYDGMIIREIPEIGVLPGTPGAGGTTTVAPVFLCGAQALGYGVALRSKVIENIRDYGDKKGAGIKMIDGIAKMYFGKGASDTTQPVQNGIVTGYVAVP